MTDPTETSPKETPETRPEASPRDSKLLLRLLYLILVAVLIGIAIAAMHALTVIQFIVMLVDKGKPNPQLAAFGKTLGDWLSRAVRFQLAESDDKPWPWRPLD